MSNRTTQAPHNESLNKAKVRKNDEFYTRIGDIEAEIVGSGCYEGCFRNKSVLCNCNDLARGEFGRFFIEQFNALGLRCLLLVSYGKNATVEVYDGHSAEYIPLTGDGDFRSEEGIGMLQHADVIVTNPPFSLFREFLLILIEYNKEFLIVGDVVNEVTCKDIFPLYMNRQVWFGQTKIRSFQTPEGPREFGKIGWYTNMGTPSHPKPLTLTKRYSGNEAYYPSYDNYEAISVDRVKDIPADYFGEMGVPSSYLSVHDPIQFEIIGTSGTLAGGAIDNRDGKFHKRPGRFYINGQKKQDRIVILRRV